MRRGLLTGAAVLGLAMAAAGCGSGAHSVSTPGSPPAALRLTENADNTTVHVTVGQTVEVDLHSTYWSELTSSAPHLLQRVDHSHPLITAGPSFCPPGAGCGAVPSDFVAKAPGTTQLTATRHVCGEALPCRPDQRTFTLTVDITSP
jgi:hypothetical protein